MKTKGKAVLFCRVSTALQKQVLPEYEKELREIAKSDGYLDDNIEVITETETASKKTLEKRKTIIQLKDLIKKDNIAVVYCSDMSRFTRIYDDGTALFEYLANKKIQFVTFDIRKKPKIRIELLNKNGRVLKKNLKILLDLVNWANGEVNASSVRVIRGRKIARESGKHLGSIPYGYTVDNNGYVQINEAEAEVVKRIYSDIIIFQTSPTAIARELIEEGYFDDGEVAVSARIRFILSSENYIGKNGYPPIITPNLHNLLSPDSKKESIFIRRAYGVSHKESSFLLYGLLLDENSKNLYLSHLTEKKYYLVRDTKTKIKHNRLDRDLTDRIVWDIVKEHFAENYETFYKEQWIIWLSSILNREDRKEKKLNDRWSSFLKQREDLSKKKENSEITEEDYNTEYLEWSKTWLNQVHKVESKLNEIEEKKKHINNLIKSSDSVPDYDNLSIIEKRTILYLSVIKINVTKTSRFNIVLRIRLKKGSTLFVDYNVRNPSNVTISHQKPLALLPPPKEEK